MLLAVSRGVVRRCLLSTSAVLRTRPDIKKIGLREVVGFGMNGQPYYIDSWTFPYPAIRFKEITPFYKALREKEKGDWRALSCEEKKTLYRVSFCSTFAEMQAPTGEWKYIVGSVLMFLSMGLWLHMFIRRMIDIPLPASHTESGRLAILKRIIAFRINPINGIASKWDYEKETWK